MTSTIREAGNQGKSVRDAFEGYANCIGFDVRRETSGPYVADDTEHRWQGWQAAHNSVWNPDQRSTESVNGLPEELWKRVVHMQGQLHLILAPEYDSKHNVELFRKRHADTLRELCRQVNLSIPEREKPSTGVDETALKAGLDAAYDYRSNSGSGPHWELSEFATVAIKAYEAARSSERETGGDYHRGFNDGLKAAAKCDEAMSGKT